jgi:hypothetical protein
MVHARIPHNKKTPRKPDKKASKDVLFETKATRKAAIVRDHQGKKRPAANAERAVNPVLINIFMLHY